MIAVWCLSFAISTCLNTSPGSAQYNYNGQKLKLLGKGGAGTVYLVLLKGTNKTYAMKELTKEDMIKRKKICRVMTEREILASANHPFIVTMYATFQTSSRLCFVMDYCAGGEFFGVLARQPHKRLRESMAKFYAAEVLLALEYLHHMGFFYRDLKPENILMRGDGHVALTDFDLSKQAQAVSPRMVEHQVSVIKKLTRMVQSPSKNNSKLNEFAIVDSEPVLEQETHSFVGTLEYLAPELVNGENQTSAVDWWTFGILIFEMMTGTTPFRSGTSEEVMGKIVGPDRVHFPEEVDISPEAKRVVRKLLRRDAKKRLGSENGATDIKNARWFEDLNFTLIRNEDPPIVPPIPDIQALIEEDKYGSSDEDEEDDRHPQSARSGSDEEPELFANFDMKREKADYQRKY